MLGAYEGKNLSIQCIKNKFYERKTIIDAILNNANLHCNLIKLTNKIISCINNGNKLLFCGNGGSAVDCQHIVTEFIVKLSKKRCSLPAISLTSNAGIITATANDYNFNKIFSRQIEGIAQPDDILIGLSTSGNSKNIIEAFKCAKNKKILTVSVTGNSRCNLRRCSDIHLVIPTHNTQVTQEMYMMVFHIICEMIDGIYE